MGAAFLMPVYENVCNEPTCDRFDQDFEWFAHTADKPDPICVCGQQTVRLVSRFACPFTGTLDRYDEIGREQKNDKDGGHIAYRVRSSRLGNDPKTGAPIADPVLIKTVQDQREFTKAEGLMMPSDLNPNIQGTKEGIQSSTESRGLKGQWI